MISVDLGSNTIRFLEYDCNSKEKLFSYEKVVKTADKLVDTGLISSEATQRIIDEIKYVKSLIDIKEPIRAVTTQAIRVATNGLDVLLEIKNQTGIGFEIISGDMEAKLTLFAVQNRLNILSKDGSSFVVVDIGGASTELTFYDNGNIVSKSFPIGIVTLAQSYDGLESIKKEINRELKIINDFVKKYYLNNAKPKQFISTAGTPTTVAAMKLGLNYATYDAELINGTELSIDELDLYLNELLSCSFEEREVLVGTGRSELIAAGILIYKEIFNILNFTHGIVVDDGLREGVVLQMCKEYSDL